MQRNITSTSVFGRRLAIASPLIFLLTCPMFAQGQTIHQRLQEKAPEVVDYLNAHKLKTVGVLKFRVQKPGEKTSDSIGPLNSLLADRLEVALILANPFDDEKQLNIVQDASSQVAKIPDVSHLTNEGRKQFFEPEFELAWGDQKLKADAFLTGIVQVNKDRKSATIGILCFDREGETLDRIGEAFQASLDASSVAEMGESYVLRGAFDDGSTTATTSSSATENSKTSTALEQQVLNESTRVRTQLTAFPLQDRSAPVALEVRYDGKPVALEFREGQAFVAEPNEGQQVELVLTRAEFVKGTLGVVLKVNGENTLFRQTGRDLECSKWLLTPEHTQTVIKGYQIKDSNVAEKFTVLSQADSDKLAVDYGRNVGQIQLTVFREQTSVEAPLTVATDEDEDLAALLRGVQPTERPQNLDALKTQIRAAARSSELTRGGMIVAGNETKNAIELTTFTPDPVPVMSVTITYYTPDAQK